MEELHYTFKHLGLSLNFKTSAIIPTHVTDDSLNRSLDPKVPGLDNCRIF